METKEYMVYWVPPNTNAPRKPIPGTECMALHEAEIIAHKLNKETAGSLGQYVPGPIQEAHHEQL